MSSIQLAGQASYQAKQLEAEFDKILDPPNAGQKPLNILQEDVNRKAGELRTAYEKVIFLNIHIAKRDHIEQRLWTRHHQVIDRFRIALARLKEHARKKPVELRKLNANFVNFIKSLTRFYRQFIQRLASYFQVEEIFPVVEKFKLEVDKSGQTLRMTDELRVAVVESCVETLIRLGDLARYRESEVLPDPKKNPDGLKDWGPATGFYDLARGLNPHLGVVYNQLAVIARNRDSIFSVIYYLYRALSIKTPFEDIRRNVNVAFVKVLKQHEAGTLNLNMRLRDEKTIEELIRSFLRLHAMYYVKGDSSDAEAVKVEMINHLITAIKDRSVAHGILNKLVVINIAAEFNAFAADEKGNPLDSNSGQMGTTYLRMNIEICTSMFKLLLHELEDVTLTPSGLSGFPDDPSQNVTNVARRMLSSVKIYSMYMLVNHRRFVDQLDDTLLNVQIKQLWQVYTNVLSALYTNFPVDQIQPLSYLLEEEVELLGFEPFTGILQARSTHQHLKVKPETEDQGHPNTEVMARLLLLNEDAKELSNFEGVPIIFDSSVPTFNYQDGIVKINQAPNYANAMYPAPTVRDIPSAFTTESFAGVVSGGSRHPTTSLASEAISATMTNKMNDMVNNLVDGSDDDEEEEILFRPRQRRDETLSQPLQVTSEPKSFATLNLEQTGGNDGTVRQKRSSNIVDNGPIRTQLKTTRLGEFAQKPASNIDSTPITANDLLGIVRGYAGTMKLDNQQGTPRASFLNPSSSQNGGWGQPSPVTPNATQRGFPIPGSENVSPAFIGVLPDSSMPDHPSSFYYQSPAPNVSMNLFMPSLNSPRTSWNPPANYGADMTPVPGQGSYALGNATRSQQANYGAMTTPRAATSAELYNENLFTDGPVPSFPMSFNPNTDYTRKNSFNPPGSPLGPWAGTHVSPPGQGYTQQSSGSKSRQVSGQLGNGSSISNNRSPGSIRPMSTDSLSSGSRPLSGVVGSNIWASQSARPDASTVTPAAGADATAANAKNPAVTVAKKKLNKYKNKKKSANVNGQAET